MAGTAGDDEIPPDDPAQHQDPDDLRVLPPDVSTRSELGARLEALRAQSGKTLRDLAKPEPLAELDAFESEAYAAAFTPDGKVLATAGSDGIVVLWDVTDPEAPQRIGEPLAGPGTRIFDLAFDPNGAHLAAAVTDGTTWLWDTSNLPAAATLAVLGPTDTPKYQVEFNPATGDLVSSGADGQLYLWPTDVDEVIDRICADAGDPITETEWATYLPDTRYSPPCPH